MILSKSILILIFWVKIPIFILIHSGGAMRTIFIIFFSILLTSSFYADEKINQIRTLQTRGLDYIEKEYRLSSEIFNEDKDGQIWIEAEESYLLNFFPNGNIIKNEKCSGGKGLIDVMSANYQIKLNKNIKTYEIWIRINYLSAGECNLNSFIDGDVLNAKIQKISVTSKELNKWVWVKINSITSAEEFRKLTLSAKGSVIILDKVLVSPSDKVNSKLILEASVGGNSVKSDSNYGEWLSEKFRPAGVKLWKRVIIKARNNEERFFKVYFKTKTKDWTVLNKDHSLDQEADYKNGDFIQFKITFSKKDKEDPIFEKIDLVYDENPFVLKSIQNVNSEIQVSFINGKIYSLINKTTGKSYFPADRGIMPFLLYTKNADGDLVEIDENDFYPSKPEIIDLKNGTVVLKIAFRGETSGLRVDYKMSLETNSDIIKSELSLKGKGNVTVAGVDFPRFQNLVLSPSWETDNVIFPLSGGLKIEAPAAGAYLNANYPEECSLPWLDIVGENGGIFIYYPDYLETKKSINFKIYPNVSMDGIQATIFNNVNDPSKILINSVFALHSNNWHEGAEKYKSLVGSKKSDPKALIPPNTYAHILSPFNDIVQELTPEQSIQLKFLNSEYLSPTINADTLQSALNSKNLVNISRLVSLSDLSLLKKSNEIFMLDSFGDNAEIFQICYPDKKMMSKVWENMSIGELKNYYKMNWVYNRVIPIFGYEGREVSLLYDRVKPFIDLNSQKTKFLDDQNLKSYQTENLTVKRYDYSDADKKLICLLYYHDGKPKEVSLALNEISKINNIYHTSIGSSYEELPFRYEENRLKFTIPNASQPYGALLLSLGGTGKDLLFGQLEQDRRTSKQNSLNVSLINFANMSARLKFSIKDKTEGEAIKISLPETIELKAGEAKNLICSIENYTTLNRVHEIEITVNNLVNNQQLVLNTIIVPTVINGDFSLNSGKNANFWSPIGAFDDYTGNNKKGSILFEGKASPLLSILFLKSNTSYKINYHFNVAQKERSLNFNVYYIENFGGKKNWQKISLVGKKSNEFDFWQSDSLEFKTPENLQSCYIEIVSPDSLGKIWLDDLSIVEN